MKIYIGQIGDAICVYDGRGTSTYPLSEFIELLQAMSTVVPQFNPEQDGADGYRTLFENDEHRQHRTRYERSKNETEQLNINWKGLLDDLLTTTEGKSEDHSASNSDIDF